MLGPSEGGLGRQGAPDGFPASGRNAYLSGANTFFADIHPEAGQFKDTTLRFYTEMTEIFQNTVTTGELAKTTGMQVQKCQHSAYSIDSSSSDADPNDANTSSATLFSVNSVSPPTHTVESDFTLPVGNTFGAQVENSYRKRAKRTRLSATQSSIQTIAGSIESLAQSFCETS